MVPPAETARSKHHRFPGAMISHSVWLSDRFSLRDRDVEAMLVARGIVVTSEAMRQWGRNCGQDDAHQRRHWRPKPGDQWYVDEV